MSDIQTHNFNDFESDFKIQDENNLSNVTEEKYDENYANEQISHASI